MIISDEIKKLYPTDVDKQEKMQDAVHTMAKGIIEIIEPMIEHRITQYMVLMAEKLDNSIKEQGK
jgi:hypothetical protein